MTESEQLRSEVRELKMRLRELRTENAELKLQQKRWLTLSTIISACSLVLAFMMFFISGDIKVEKHYSGSQGENQAGVYDLNQPRVEDRLPAKPLTKEEPLVAKSIEKEEKDSFLDAPDLNIDVDPTPKVEKAIEPSRGGAFALPGAESKPKRKRIMYEVKKNDTLWSIARKIMGSSKSSNINKIKKDNGLTDSRLDPGMTLVIIVETE